MRHPILSCLFVVFAIILFASPALAGRCRIKNTTKHSFKVQSGNVSNQSVGSNTTTSIASGKIIAKSKTVAVGGSCKDGDSIKIVEEKGVVMIVPSR